MVLGELQDVEEGEEAVHVIGKHLRLDCPKKKAGDPAELNQRQEARGASSRARQPAVRLLPTSKVLGVYKCDGLHLPVDLFLTACLCMCLALPIYVGSKRLAAAASEATATATHGAARQMQLN